MRRLIFASFLLTQNASGHGVMSNPHAGFDNAPVHVEQCHDLGPGMRYYYGEHPNWDADGFEWDFSRTQYGGNLQRLFEAKGLNDKKLRQVPIHIAALIDRYHVWWQDPNEGGRVGFTVDHRGPCAVFIDSKQLYYHKDCTTVHREAPARLPVDIAAHCPVWGCTLHIYWLATGIRPIDHNQLQYYHNAVRLVGGTARRLRRERFLLSFPSAPKVDADV